MARTARLGTGWRRAVRRFVPTGLRKGKIAGKLVYLAVHDANYPRNRLLRERLVEAGYEVVVVPVPLAGGYLRRCLKLLVAGMAAARNTRCVLLAEFSLQYAWVAWAIARARRAPLVVDWFVGLYETNVEDWHRFPPSSRRARVHAMFDAFAVRLADMVITDTKIRAASLSRYSTDTPRMSLPVGAPDWAVARASPEHRETFKVLYYGSYIPLHGVETIIAASALLPVGSSIEFTFLGGGELRPKAEVAAGDDPRCHFIPPVPEEALAAIIGEHDVVLGIFGESNKASTVIANKVWQGLACGKVVVTRTSGALEEITDLVGSQLVQVPPSDPRALSSALVALEKRRPLPVDTTVASVLAGYSRSLYDLFIDEMDNLTHPPVRVSCVIRRKLKPSRDIFLVRRSHGVSSSGVPLPPVQFRMGGEHFRADEDFVSSALAEVDRLVSLAGLEKSSRLLDWGCGAGRLAIGIAERFERIGLYHGVDVQERLISWADRHLGNHAGFEFTHVDISNARYNPSGESVQSIPGQDANYDVFYAYSVFSHLNAEDCRRYMSEVARLLKPGGAAFITAFVETNVPEVEENPTGYGPMAWSGPLHCVRFERGFFEHIVQANPLSIESMYHGQETDGQSLYILRKT